MPHDHLGPLLVLDGGTVLMIVHAVGQIADQDATDAPLRHLSNGEGPLQDAHIRVDSHDKQIRNPLFLEQTVYLLPLIGDRVAGGDPDARVLPAPGLKEFVGAGVAAALCVVNR